MRFPGDEDFFGVPKAKAAVCRTQKRARKFLEKHRNTARHVVDHLSAEGSVQQQLSNDPRINEANYWAPLTPK